MSPHVPRICQPKKYPFIIRVQSFYIPWYFWASEILLLSILIYKSSQYRIKFFSNSRTFYSNDGESVASLRCSCHGRQEKLPLILTINILPLTLSLFHLLYFSSTFAWFIDIDRHNTAALLALALQLNVYYIARSNFIAIIKLWIDQFFKLFDSDGVEWLTNRDRD